MAAVPAPEVLDNQHQLTIRHLGTVYRGDATVTTDHAGSHLTLTLTSATGHLRLRVPPELNDLLAIQEVLARAVERVLPMTRENPLDIDPETGATWTDEQKLLLARLWQDHVDRSDQRGFESIARMLGRRPTAVRQQLARQGLLRTRVGGGGQRDTGSPPAGSPSDGTAGTGLPLGEDVTPPGYTPPGPDGGQHQPTTEHEPPAAGPAADATDASSEDSSTWDPGENDPPFQDSR